MKVFTGYGATAVEAPKKRRHFDWVRLILIVLAVDVALAFVFIFAGYMWAKYGGL